MALDILTLTLVALIGFYVAAGLRIVHEHEQGVVKRFGRFMTVLGPGLQLVVPFVDRMRKVDLRELTVVERIDPASGRGMVHMWDQSWPAKSADGTVISAGAALDGRFVVVTESQTGF